MGVACCHGERTSGWVWHVAMVRGLVGEGWQIGIHSCSDTWYLMALRIYILHNLPPYLHMHYSTSWRAIQKRGQ